MNRLSAALVLLFVLATGSLASGSSPAHAEGIEVRSQAAQNRFPQGLEFTIFMASNADITTARLRYRPLPEGNLATVRPTCTTGTVVNCTATVGRSQDSYLAPGKEVQYYWEIEDAAGQKLETAPASTTYVDVRFDWQTVSDGSVTVFYYFGDAGSAQTVLRTARETIDRFSALEATRLDIPIKIFVYQSTRDLSAAAQGRRTDTVHLGQLAADDTVLASRDVDFLNVVRHEVTHAVTARATRGHIAGIPIWVNEGISTYSQSRLLEGEQQALDLALRRDRMLPITGLTASARDTSDTVSLFYAQAYSIIKYLIEAQGQEKFAPFIAAFRDETLDGALRRAYGFGQFELEDMWRRSLGLPPANNAAGPASGDRPQPTLVPFGAGGQPATEASPGPSSPGEASHASGEGGSSALPLIIGAIVVLALAAGGGGFYYLKRRPTPTP